MKRNVFLLAACQALLNTSTSLLIATSALVGLALAPMAALSTVPLGLQFLAMMTATIPASLLMKRQGRRVGFLAGCVVGVSGGVICSVAIHTSSFVLFCVGSALLGVFNGVGQYYRFTAADVASAEYRSRAISLVMAGGVVAAFAGPNLANVTREMVSPFAFTGSYASLVLLYLASMALIAFMRIPAPSPEERAGVGRPLVEIVRQPSFVIAALGGMVSYGVMSVLMTATPLAMAGCGFAFSEAAWVIQWHVFGMFAPSFFTGHVIRRFGATKVVVVGGLLMFACALVNLAGVEMLNFWSALLLLGLGWNFMFIGSTALLTETYHPAEKAKVQGVNDFLVFGTVALAATSSGVLHQLLGWEAMNLSVLPLLAAVLVATCWLRGAPRRGRVHAR